jgi:hypothetical protein
VAEVSEFGITLPDDVVEAIAAAIAHELAGCLPPESETAEPWRLFSLEDAAARLGRSTRWVRERKEQIGYVRLDGGALAFELEDLQAFARLRRVGR